MNFSYSYAAIIALLLVACSSGEEQFDASGVFEADEIIISSEVAGKVLGFQQEEGDELKAGQVVGTIDCKNLSLQKTQVEYSIQALSEKKNSATPQNEITAQQLKTQEKQLATQLEQRKVLEKEQIRLRNLVNANAAPSKQLDDIEGQLAVLAKQIEATKSQTEVYRQQITSQKQQIAIQNRGIVSEAKPLQERVAQLDDQLQRCTITNPINGTLLIKYAKTNEIVTPGKPLYKLADLRTMTLRTYVSGEQLPQLKLNQPVKVLIDKGSDTYKEMKGTVDWISSKAEFTPKTIQTKDERANLVYAVKIKVKNDGYIKIGMYGEIKL